MLYYLREKLGKKKSIIMLFILTIIIQIVMAVIMRDINMKEFLEMQITLNKEKFVSIINSWNEAQINAYHLHFYIDFIYLIFYALLLFSIVSFFYNHANVKSRGVIFLLLPFIISLFDIIENTFHIYFIATNYQMPSYLVMISGVFSIQKWVFVFIELYVIALLFFKLTILHKR